MSKYVNKTRMSLREAELFFRNNGSDADFAAKNTALSKVELLNFKNAALLLKESRDFIDNVSSKEKFVTDTFRYGFIGKKITDINGNEYVQTTRGKPYGYLAAVFDGEKVYAGFTYLSTTEKYPHSIIGQAIALQRAIENRNKGCDIEIESKNPYLKSTDKLQFKYFHDRVLRYFRPDDFSHSRGSTPIEQLDYDEIHIWQFLMQVKKAKNKTEFKKSMKDLENSIKKVAKIK